MGTLGYCGANIVQRCKENAERRRCVPRSAPADVLGIQGRGGFSSRCSFFAALVPLDEGGSPGPGPRDSGKKEHQALFTSSGIRRLPKGRSVDVASHEGVPLSRNGASDCLGHSGS